MFSTVSLYNYTCETDEKMQIERDKSMNITNENIDGGKSFDWGKTSLDYAKEAAYGNRFCRI